MGFEQARYGSLYISSYTTGQIGFMLCEKNSSEATSMEQVEKRFENMEAKGLGTTYYQPKLQERYDWICLNVSCPTLCYG